MTAPNVNNSPSVDTYYGDTNIADSYDFGYDVTSAGTSQLNTDNPGGHSIYIGGDGSPTLVAPTGGGNMSLSELTLMITKMRNKEGEGSLKAIVKSIKHHVASQQTQNTARFNALQESWKAMEKAAKAGKWGKVFGFISKYVIPAITFALGAALTATGVAAPLGIFLMATSVVNAVMSTDAVQNGLKKAGMSDGALMGLNIGIMAAELVAAVAITVMTGGAGSGLVAAEAEEIGVVVAEGTAEGVEAGTAAAETGTGIAEASSEGIQAGSEITSNTSEIMQLSQEGVTTTETLGETGEIGELGAAAGETGEVGEAAEASEAVDKVEKMKKAARMATQARQVVEDSNAIAKDVDDVVVGVYTNQSDHAKDDMKRALAEIAREASLQQQDDKVLQDLIDNIQQIFASCSKLLSGQQQQDLNISRQIGLSQAF